MLKSLSLHKKILLSNLLASFLFLSILTLIIYYSNEHLESQLLDIQVSSELENFKQKLNQSPNIKLPRTAHLSIYLNSRKNTDPLPEFIRTLSIGVHHEVRNAPNLYQITVEPYNNDIIYVLYDISDIESADNLLGLIIVSSWVLLFFMMVVLSNYLSKTISQPIQKLQSDVSNINPDQRGIQINTNLEHNEITEIAQAFNRYLDKMDDYVIKQMAFSAMASHELRSPLTVVQTSADLISCLHTDDATQIHVNKIQRSSNNMSRLIHALLHITRDKNKPFEKKKINLNAIVALIENNFQLEINAKNCQLINNVPLDATIDSDEILINVILSNIIKNAIKFSESGTIIIEYNDKTLSIIDTGKGIKSEDIEHIFQFKFKGDNSQGFGIGLYISKLICDHQNWQLNVVKNEHHGIRVNILF